MDVAYSPQMGSDAPLRPVGYAQGMLRAELHRDLVNQSIATIRASVLVGVPARAEIVRQVVRSLHDAHRVVRVEQRRIVNVGSDHVEGQRRGRAKFHVVGHVHVECAAAFY